MVLEAGLLGVWPPAPGAPVLPWLPEALPIAPPIELVVAEGLGELKVPPVPVPPVFCCAPLGGVVEPLEGVPIEPLPIEPPEVPDPIEPLLDEPLVELVVFWVPPEAGMLPPCIEPPIEPPCFIMPPCIMPPCIMPPCIIIDIVREFSAI